MANYGEYAQVFKYNKAIMQIKKGFLGPRISILTDMGEVFIFVNKKQASEFKLLLEQNSH